MRTSGQDDPFGEWGVELALEPRNFRSRPLAHQLGASVFLKAAVPQRMELCWLLRSSVPRVDWRQPVLGNFHPR